MLPGALVHLPAQLRAVIREGGRAASKSLAQAGSLWGGSGFAAQPATVPTARPPIAAASQPHSPPHSPSPYGRILGDSPDHVEGPFLFEITFLGTSASAPSVHRGLSAQIVAHNEYRFLIDCGEGTQRQILQSGLGFKRLERILITHGHLDHILGLAGLVSTFLRWETIDQLEIWAGRWALDRIHDLLYGIVLKGARAPFPLQLREIKPGRLLEAESFALSAFPVQHRGTGSFGFAFEEKSHRPFLAERAEALGVPAGPVRRQLVAGETVTLPDGRQVAPDDVLGPAVGGARLVHVGDCGETDSLVEVARDADGLVIESTYLEIEAPLAREYGHLTAAQAARLARDAGVKQLYLTHLSRRNRERDVLDEAQRIFPNTVVARDFDQYKVMKDKENPPLVTQNLRRRPPLSRNT
jgi:ribonuclease Z